MHLAYSAISTNTPHQQQENSLSERQLRYLAYLVTCQKYRREIVAIQKYLPGWAPEFR
ncbi:hypothetical protein [Mucilaginibacter sp.]|uniref:hypothetical protein n=1 Tax=Mucilaginibacter sp. TaxID=1882438 RepID=UPI002841A35D|nr:hypothetical protein [Mucilaginibacter sp.]MDR3693350.1 hypothetical protein [Mucilaginibacter sp.]